MSSALLLRHEGMASLERGVVSWFEPLPSLLGQGGARAWINYRPSALARTLCILDLLLLLRDSIIEF